MERLIISGAVNLVRRWVSQVAQLSLTNAANDKIFKQSRKHNHAHLKGDMLSSW